MRVSTASIVRREANCFTSKDHALTTRFATEKTIPNFPSSSLFTDRYNHNWKVVIDKKDDTVNMFIPCGTQMLWYGAEHSGRRFSSAGKIKRTSRLSMQGSELRSVGIKIKPPENGAWIQSVGTTFWICPRKG